MYGISASPAELFVYKEGGVFNVSVRTQADRTWSASPDASWLFITSGASGQGNGTMQLSIPANDGQLVATTFTGVASPFGGDASTPGGATVIGGLFPFGAPTRIGNVNLAVSPFGRSISVKVTQAASDCTMNVFPSKLSVGELADTYTLSVVTPSHCDWTVAESLPWLTLNPTSHGKGPATVTVKVVSNPLPVARHGSIVVAGKTIPITQAAGECLTCGL